MSLAERYERYSLWCRALGVEPAPYVVWAKEIAKISEVSAIKGFGNNLLQTT